MNPFNQGIILYASHGGAGSFTGPDGNAGTVRTLTNANYITSDEIMVGRSGALALSVGGVISAGMASATVIVEAEQVDADNPTLVKWSTIGTVRGDDPAVAPAASQTIVAADLVGESVADGVGGGAATEVLDVRLLTTDHVASVKLRCIVKATNATQAGDYITIRAAVL